MVSSVYPRLLIFLPAFLISAYDSSSLAFGNMYSVYKLNRVTVYSLDVLLSQFELSIVLSGPHCCLMACIQVSQEAGKIMSVLIITSDY